MALWTPSWPRLLLQVCIPHALMLKVKNWTCVLNQSTHEVLLPVCLISMLVLHCSSTVVPSTLIFNVTQWRSTELEQLIIFSLSHIPPTKFLAVAPFFTFWRLSTFFWLVGGSSFVLSEWVLRLNVWMSFFTLKSIVNLNLNLGLRGVLRSTSDSCLYCHAQLVVRSGDSCHWLLWISVDEVVLPSLM